MTILLPGICIGFGRVVPTALFTYWWSYCKWVNSFGIDSPNSCSPLSAYVSLLFSPQEVADPTTLLGSFPNPVESLNVGHANSFLYRIEAFLFSIFSASYVICFLFSLALSDTAVLDISTWKSSPEDATSNGTLGGEVFFRLWVPCEFSLPWYSYLIFVCILQPGLPVPGFDFIWW